MNALQWQTAQHSLEGGRLDEMHQEFVALLNLLAAADDEEEAAFLKRLIAHCEMHFGQEELWMREVALPTREQHVRDHDDVLALLQHALDDVRRGQAGAGRDLVEPLGNWFERHGDTLDAALAFLMQAKLHRGEAAVIPAVG
ncbi:MAG: hemerythrin domain-containing protein [Candidatus Dactylopiibacterium sp.]|nr:hemerythrin domain-containing protein [Candidatus Dactylopiibacterium sp.]